jgi:hypothetical protein
MSITFGIQNQDGSFAYRCNCSERWCDACDSAWANGEDAPAQFFCENCTDTEINMANDNAYDLMIWIGLAVGYCGSIPARELAVKCRRRLWDEARNHDAPIEGYSDGRIHFAGRRPGYLRERTAQVLALCEKAGERIIYWG